MVGEVGAADEIAHCRDGMIGIYGNHMGIPDVDRADVAGLAAERGDDFLVVGEAEFADEFLRLDLIQIMVAAQQDQAKAAGLALFELGADDSNGLDHLLDADLQEGGNVLAAHHAGRGYGLQQFGRSRARRGGRQRLGKFNVGGILRTGRRAEGDGVFARIGKYVKLMRAGPADRAGIGCHGAELQAEAGEDAGVGFVHVLVFALQIGERSMERVAVLHQKLAAAHDAETRTDLVAEFGLDLVEMTRQLAIALDLAAHHVGDDFLVVGPTTKSR